MSYSPEIKRALRVIILSQCVGMIGPLLFSNGFMLAYILQLGIPAYRILFLFALMPLMNMALIFPLAWAADCKGKKKIGATGLLISIAGFIALPMAACMQHRAALWLTAGILIFSVGSTASSASWFALLSPIVPEEIRGRWFAQMRTAWQTIAIFFSLGLTVLLRHHPELYVFQIVLVASSILMIVRFFLYLQIPELDPLRPPRTGFFSILGGILRIPGYLRFCIYCFLLSFTGAASGLFGLLEKNVLGFTDSLLIMMGNLTAIGTVAGFLIGGKIVDRFGAKPVFLTGHITASLALSAILFRNIFPASPAVTMGIISLLFGAMQGSSGIAGTSELLALIPAENKSVSTAFNMALTFAGLSLAGFLNGHLLKINILPAAWNLAGHTLSDYDALLAGFMGITLLMAIAVGLVPQIRNLRSQWFPQNR